MPMSIPLLPFLWGTARALNTHPANVHKHHFAGVIIVPPACCNRLYFFDSSASNTRETYLPLLLISRLLRNFFLLLRLKIITQGFQICIIRICYLAISDPGNTAFLDACFFSN